MQIAEGLIGETAVFTGPCFSLDLLIETRGVERLKRHPAFRELHGGVVATGFPESSVEMEIIWRRDNYCHTVFLSPSR